LAIALRLSEKAISHAVNECTGNNINAFINGYRIRLAERLLLDPSYNYLTIDAIAEESGFSNKVTFYKAFRRVHPFSPKEFKVGKTA
jgi:AraC-like DNA-binding protein